MKPTTSLRLRTLSVLSILAVTALPALPDGLPVSTNQGGELTAREQNASAAPASDPRLGQKIWIHATDRRIADLLADLTRATGVTLVPGMEVSDERVSFWADAIPLKDAMRDLRHLHSYYWSRARRHGEYAYSLWQDAQSRAREEAEVQRLALEQQRNFQDEIWRHVRALHASDAELKQIAQEDPYFVAQMLHPVVRAGYQLFAALSPDQQAQLLQGQTPSRGLPAGELMMVIPLRTFTAPSAAHPGQTEKVFAQPDAAARWTPQGDAVSLEWSAMTPAQRTVLQSIFGAAQSQAQKERARFTPPGTWYDHSLPALKAADLETATASLFRWGEPGWEGMSLRVDFRSGGIPWCLYSNITVPPYHDRVYNDSIRKGEFRVWPGAQDDLNRYLDGGRKGAGAPPRMAATAHASTPPDPVLDAPISFTWKLPTRGGKPLLSFDELLAALYGVTRRPLVLDGGRDTFLEMPGTGPAEFHWERRPLRALLQRLYPRWDCASHDGALYLRSPDRLQERLNPVPPAVDQFLKHRQGPFTLDDLALVARSLSPWQVVKLIGDLPAPAVDQILAAQELLNLYGELAPAQRTRLADGVPFASLTPPQERLFLHFAQRWRPFVEPWRFQRGALRLTVQPLPAPEPSPWFDAWRSTARAVFEVSFQEGDAQSFPVELFTRQEQPGVIWTLSDWVGRPFPFAAERARSPDDENAAWKPALADRRLRGRAEAIIISRPFVNPYAGTQPPPSPAGWARALADRLRSAGVTVVLLTLGGVETSVEEREAGAIRAPMPPSNPLILRDAGGVNGEPFDAAGQIDQYPDILVIDRSEIVRAVFQGPAAWDAAAVEAAARRAGAPTGLPKSTRLPADRLTAH
jgi:hypothetical protein